VPVKAVRIHDDGGPEVLRYEDAPDPEPGPEGESAAASRPRRSQSRRRSAHA
jgi:hypothetical protein